MNTKNLHIGDVIKNYKLLCEIVEEECKAGQSKVCQLNNFERYFTWERKGQKYIITNIYDEPLKKNRVNNNLGHYKVGDSSKYLIPKEFNQNKGVYIIQLYSNVYIGSTTVGFRERFTQHYQNRDNNMPHTQDLLLHGATYKILWIAPINAKEDEIRIKEQEFISKYQKDPEYNLINGRDIVDIPKYRKKKIQKKRIAINENDYQKVISLLKQNEIKIY